jgi:hypothetical protein
MEILNIIALLVKLQESFIIQARNVLLFKIKIKVCILLMKFINFKSIYQKNNLSY